MDNYHRELEAVLGDAQVVARFRAKAWRVAGSDCVWWAGAVSDRGHGRFWLRPHSPGAGRVIIAHRFAWALAYGAAALQATPVLGHLGVCDNPLCQNVEHMAPSSGRENTQDWSRRRHRVGGPLNDLRGSLGRALAVRDAIRKDGDVQAALEAGDKHRDQLTLFEVAD